MPTFKVRHVTTDYCNMYSGLPTVALAQQGARHCTDNTHNLHRHLSGRVVSRAGKATGKYKDCYNFKWDADGSISWADMEKDFSEWEVVSDDTEMLIFFTSEEVMCAK